MYNHPDPKSAKRIILALDVPSEQARELVKKLARKVAYFKIGFEQIHDHKDEELARIAHEEGGAVFLDGKIHDIPNTVAKAAAGLTRSGVELFNIHASGGVAMMQAAVKAATDAANAQAEAAGISAAEFGRPLVIGVTLLTSLDYKALVDIGLAPDITGSNPADIEADKGLFIERLVLNLARAAKRAGLDGVVASPLEAPRIREACGPDFRIITPGIRTGDSPPDDQRRTRTAAEAIAGGSDFLVIGRPILAAQDPVAAAERFNEEVAAALRAKENTEAEAGRCAMGTPTGWEEAGLPRQE